MSQGHVLIVDDDLALLQALPQALRLRMPGLTVDTADSGAAALDRVAARDYDAIVTDVKMPGMDGFELLAGIRTNRPHTPTLMITGHGGPHRAGPARASEADHLINDATEQES